MIDASDDHHLVGHRQIEAQRLGEKERGHRFIEGDAVVVEVRADTGREARRLRRDLHALEAPERDRHGGEAAVARHGGHDRVGPLPQVDLRRLLPHQPGDERIIDKRVDGEPREHGGEEDPEDGEDPMPALPTTCATTPKTASGTARMIQPSTCTNKA